MGRMACETPKEARGGGGRRYLCVCWVALLTLAVRITVAAAEPLLAGVAREPAPRRDEPIIMIIN